MRDRSVAAEGSVVALLDAFIVALSHFDGRSRPRAASAARSRKLSRRTSFRSDERAMKRLSKTRIEGLPYHPVCVEMSRATEGSREAIFLEAVSVRYTPARVWAWLRIPYLLSNLATSSSKHGERWRQVSELALNPRAASRVTIHRIENPHARCHSCRAPSAAGAQDLPCTCTSGRSLPSRLSKQHHRLAAPTAW